jgi:SAM-dependent methyltransferase
VAAEAYARGARVVAVDADPGMAGMTAEAVPGAEVRVAALPELPFQDGEFDAVVANFVLNHVGRPTAGLAEMRRVTRPGGKVVVTIWATPPGAGQALLGRAAEAAGVSRPKALPAVAAEEDFPRTEAGLAALLGAAGLAEPGCERLEWVHRADPEEWWAGAAAGVATIGQVVLSQGPGRTAEIRRHYDRLRAEFAAPDGLLALPHAALLAHAIR